MVVKNYLHVQQVTFACLGINLKAVTNDDILKYPVLCYVPLVFAITHSMAIIHYACVHHQDFVEVTDSLSLLCQSLLAIWKMLVFLGKRKEFVTLIKEITDYNERAANQQLEVVIEENRREVFLSRTYFQIVKLAAFFAFSNPVVVAIIFWFLQHKLILVPPYKATYFWSYDNLAGYSLVYLWNLLSIYFLVPITIGIDTLFLWLVCNICAQYRILFDRLKIIATKCHDTKEFNTEFEQFFQHHVAVLKLTKKLNNAYSIIIFIKFIISCSQICCLAFRLSRPYDSYGMAIYQSIFLLTVALQLMLYCYNGQRIKDESVQVSLEIYAALDWSQLSKTQAKLFLLPLMRSQKSTHLSGMFFILDLSLFLWVFKTAGSLITALKTLDANQE